MHRLLLAALVGAATLLPVVSHAETWAERQARADQERARERCLRGGGKPDTPEFQTCIRDTVAWMEQNRRLQQRMYTQ